MPDRGDNRRCGMINRLRHNLFIESPEIFNGSAAPADDNHIEAETVQRLNAADNILRRLLPLHIRRINGNLHMRIACSCNIDNIPYCRAGPCGNNAKLPDIRRNLLLVALIEQPPRFQLLLEQLILLIQRADAVMRDRIRVKLI